MGSTDEKTFSQRVLSRKFIFTLFSFLVVSGLLYMGKLPASNYEAVVVAIILTYLSSNVAYRFVDNRYSNVNNADNKNESISDEPDIDSIDIEEDRHELKRYKK